MRSFERLPSKLLLRFLHDLPHGPPSHSLLLACSFDCAFNLPFPLRANFLFRELVNWTIRPEPNDL
jgi:hypothetical protein